MSTTEKHPREVVCAAEPCEGVSLLGPRDVPLGGPRAMTVRRTLPQRARSLIGPWCFVDHFGPDDVAATGGMAVPRHPHTGLATVTLLFEGRIDHVDSTGFANTVRPAEVNLMIAGRGVSHSEFSTDDTTILHGVQLWYALPDALRGGMPGSQHHVPELVEVPGGAVRTFVGRFAGVASPVDTRTPALAAEVLVPPGGRLEVDLEPGDEHGLLVDTGAIHAEVVGADGTDGPDGPDGDRAAADGQAADPTDDSGLGGAPGLEIASDQLAHIPAGARRLAITAGDVAARVIVIGGPPFSEEIVMWWNFVGRSHEEIAAFRAEWQREIGASDVQDLAVPPGEPARSAEQARSAETSALEPLAADASRFGPFPSGAPAPLPAPTLPNARIRPRRHPRGSAR